MIKITYYNNGKPKDKYQEYKIKKLQLEYATYYIMNSAHNRINARFNCADVLHPKSCVGWINLFYGNDFVTTVKCKAIVDAIKRTTPRRI